MELFDLHCDTLNEIREKRESIEHNTCHVSLEKAMSVFDRYVQVMAVWSIHSRDGEQNYKDFLKTVSDVLPAIPSREGFDHILAVEGGKLLCSDISRLEVLAKSGVRIFTPVWAGINEIGGAFDTDIGLTDFGEAVINGCFDLGIVPDMSHSSDKLFYDTVKIAEKHGKPIIASHSCSRAVCDHPRNLTDDMARLITSLGGVVGVNLVDAHLGEATIDAVLRHIEHLTELVGEDKICLGCDLDGTDVLPEGIKDISDLPKIYEKLCENKYSKVFCDGIFYTNAQNFAKSNLLR